MVKLINRIISSDDSVFSDHKKTSVFTLSKTYPAYLVLIVTIAVSFLIKDFMTDNVHFDKKSSFEKAMTSIVSRLDRKYEASVQVMKSISSLWSFKFDVTRDRFELFGAVPISSYPSIRTINFVQGVSKDSIGIFHWNSRREGYYDIKLHPKLDRDYHYYLKYLVPFEENQDRSGFDFASDKVMLDALERSRDNNQVVVTRVYETRPDTIGFYIVSSIYEQDKKIETLEQKRNHYFGAIVLEIDSDLYFKQAMGKGLPNDSTVYYEFLDTENDNLQIHKSYNYDRNTNTTPLFDESKDFVIADKTFRGRFASVQDFGGTLKNYLPWLTFVISIILSFSFFAFISSVIMSKSKAQDIAHKITESQSRILETSRDIIGSLNMNGEWDSINHASVTLLGYQPDDLIGKNLKINLENESDFDSITALFNSSPDHSTHRVDYKVKNKSNRTKWINWSFTISKKDKKVYCIGRDVTLEKAIKEEQIIKYKQAQLAETLTKEASEFKSYFLIKLSHQLRNSLTGIIGYLQLLSGKKYSSDEERDEFIESAEQASMEFYQFTTDLVEAALLKDFNSSIEISTTKLGKVIDGSYDQMKQSDSEAASTINIDISQESADIAVIADREVLKQAFKEIFNAYSTGLDRTGFRIKALDNTLEGAVEIEILGSSNKLVADMIDVYMSNRDNIVEAVRLDNTDILLNITNAVSHIQRMNGTVTLASLENDEGNVFMVTLPTINHFI